MRSIRRMTLRLCTSVLTLISYFLTRITVFVLIILKKTIVWVEKQYYLRWRRFGRKMAGATGAAGRVQNDLLFLNELRVRARNAFEYYIEQAKYFQRYWSLFFFSFLRFKFNLFIDHRKQKREPTRTLYVGTTAAWIVYGVCAGNRMTHTHETLCFVSVRSFDGGSAVTLVNPKFFLVCLSFSVFFYAWRIRIRSSEKGP